jgi:hypothetical protein
VHRARHSRPKPKNPLKTTATSKPSTFMPGYGAGIHPNRAQPSRNRPLVRTCTTMTALSLFDHAAPNRHRCLSPGGMAAPLAAVDGPRLSAPAVAPGLALGRGRHKPGTPRHQWIKCERHCASSGGELTNKTSGEAEAGSAGEQPAEE